MSGPPGSVEDERLTGRIREVHQENFEAYGYPRVWHELRRQGEQVGRDRVARLMRGAGIVGAKRRGKPWRTTIPDPTAPKRPDLVNRDFSSTAPDRLWVGDFTYLRTWEGRLFFAFIIDVFSRMIVGWQLAANMRTTLVLDALRMALWTRQPGADFALVAHTDQGSQYISEDYTQQLDDAKVLASVGSVGDCYDNALAESFVDSYKTELIADRVWCTKAQLELATVDYVGWFNHRRLHTSIGNRPPIEHEREYWARVGLPPRRPVQQRIAGRVPIGLGAEGTSERSASAGFARVSNGLGVAGASAGKSPGSDHPDFRRGIHAA